MKKLFLIIICCPPNISIEYHKINDTTYLVNQMDYAYVSDSGVEYKGYRLKNGTDHFIPAERLIEDLICTEFWNRN